MAHLPGIPWGNDVETKPVVVSCIRIRTKEGQVMSGDATSPARTCLRAGEVDPQGQAKLCETIQPSFSSSHVNDIPRVGGESWGVAFVLAMIVLMVYVKIGGGK